MENMKKRNFKKVVSLLLSLQLLLASIPSATIFAQGLNEPAEQTESNWVTLPGVTSKYGEPEIETPKSEAIDISDAMLYDQNINFGSYSLATIQAEERNLDPEEKNYIETVAEALQTPLGLAGFEEMMAEDDEVVDVIVWMQELPDALVEAYDGNFPKLDAFAANVALAHNIIQAASSTSVLEIKYQYNYVFAGYALSAPMSYVKTLSELPGVYAVIPDDLVYADVIETTDDFVRDPDYSFVGMNESREAFRLDEIHAAGITGKDQVTDIAVKVGVIDSGIDYNHPDLKDVYKGGWNFVSAADDHNVRNRPANDPMETTYEQWQRSGQLETNTNGSKYYTSHGTHVSGTIAAQAKNTQGVYKALGMAPEVELYVARALGAYGSGATSGITAAIEDFAQEGGNLPKVDVLNMSLGSATTTAYTSQAFTVNNAVIAGVATVNSAGNTGTPSGITDPFQRRTFTLGSYAVAYLTVTTAASQTGATSGKIFSDASVTIDGVKTDIPAWLSGQDVNNTFDNGRIGGDNPPTYIDGKGYEAFVFMNENGTHKLPADYALLPDGYLAGKILITLRGTGAAYTEVLEHALRLGAGAWIIINSAEGGETYLTSITVGGTKVNSMPIFSIYGSHKNVLLAAMNNQKTVYVELGNMSKVYAPDEPAYFSSVGPVPVTYGLKPDIMAPGYNIVSTQPAFIVNSNHNPSDYTYAYASMSGTSMATPHIAGILALMKQRYPEATPAELKARLMNTANPDLIKGMPDDDTVASVIEFGAGFVNPYRALIEEYGRDIYVTVTGDVPGQVASAPFADQTLSSISFGLVEPGQTSSVFPVTIHGNPSSVSVRVDYKTSRWSLPAEENGIQLNVSEIDNNEFTVSVTAPDPQVFGYFEGQVVVIADGREYIIPWLLVTGVPKLPFKVEYVLPLTPIISTETPTTATHASAHGYRSSLFFRFIGDDAWPEGRTNIALINAETGIIDYYMGTLDTSELKGNTTYSLPSALEQTATPVVNGEIGDEFVPVEPGVYYIGMTVGNEVYYDDNYGVVYSADRPELTFDNEGLFQISADDETAKISGKIYSKAIALAEEYDLYYYYGEDLSNPPPLHKITQKYNALAFDRAENAAGNVYMGRVIRLPVPGQTDLTSKICNDRGEFELTVNVTEYAKNGWDYPFITVNGLSTMVGVEFYELGHYKGTSGTGNWLVYGITKSTPETVKYGTDFDGDGPPEVRLPQITGVTINLVNVIGTTCDIMVYIDQGPTSMLKKDFTVEAYVDGMPKAVTAYSLEEYQDAKRWYFPMYEYGLDQPVEVKIWYKRGTPEEQFVTKTVVIPADNSQDAPAIISIAPLNGELSIIMNPGATAIGPHNYDIKEYRFGRAAQTTLASVVWYDEAIDLEQVQTAPYTYTISSTAVTNIGFAKWSFPDEKVDLVSSAAQGGYNTGWKIFRTTVEYKGKSVSTDTVAIILNNGGSGETAYRNHTFYVGNGAVVSSSAIMSTTASTTVQAESMFTPPAGMEFLYWCTDPLGNGARYPVGATLPRVNAAGGDFTLYAIWTAKINNFKGIVTPTPIRNLPNGSPKTVAGLTLPATVQISTDLGNISANVVWDVQNCNYNPALKTAQTFYVYGTVTIPEGVKNNTPTVITSIQVTVNAAINLLSITNPQDKSDLENGVEKSAVGLGLPETVEIVTTAGTKTADVSWNVDACSYNPSNRQEQTFEVIGAVTLPSGVENLNGLELSAKIMVTVLAKQGQIEVNLIGLEGANGLSTMFFDEMTEDMTAAFIQAETQVEYSVNGGERTELTARNFSVDAESKTASFEFDAFERDLYEDKTITVYVSYNGEELSFEFELNKWPVVTGITVSTGALTTIKAKSALNVTYTVTPADAEESIVSVEWKSSNATIASVEDGVITGIKAGTVTITLTVTTVHGTVITKTFAVKVS